MFRDNCFIEILEKYLSEKENFFYEYYDGKEQCTLIDN